MSVTNNPAKEKRPIDYAFVAITVATWLTIFVNPAIGLAAGLGVYYLATAKKKKWTLGEILFSLAIIAATFLLVDIYDNWGSFKDGFSTGVQAEK